MAEDFAKEVRDLWTQGEEADHDNRKEALLDLKMAANDQWDERDRQARESTEGRRAPRPCLTINSGLAIINQVTGDALANQSAITVLPREGGDKNVAEVRSELIRGIEHHSKAQRVYRQSFESAAMCGIGNFKISLDYAYEDAFERDLFIRGIPNPLAVLWDPMAADPTARDAGWCFVADHITTDEYERRFPDAAKPSLFDSDAHASGWLEGDTVRVAEYWKITEREREIALMMNGSVQDVTGQKPGDLVGRVYVGPDGKPRMRKSKCKYATMQLTNGQEALTDPFELKLPRLPIIRVTGQEIWVGDKRVRFGLMRLLRDHLRMKNYLRSVATEKLMFAPRANFTAAASAVKGRLADWDNTLVYNDGAPEPKAVTESNLQALIAMSEISQQDMKDVTGIHDASLGIKSNETSGVAIQRRQHEGDIATIAYHDNMNAAKQEAGEVLNALIPIAYDTPRTIRVIGQDDAVRLLRANDPEFVPTDTVKENVNLAVGRYDVAISTGPAYMTRRQEAGAQLMELARAPGSTVMERAGDLVVKALDIPDGDPLAERLAPPGAVESEDMTPEQQQAAMEAKQKQAQVEQMELANAQAALEKAQAEARKAEAEADKAELEVANMKKDMGLEGAKLAGMATGEIVPEPEPQQDKAA